MKMTKIESARIVREQEGDCGLDIECEECFNMKKCDKYQTDRNCGKITMEQWSAFCLADAEAYIKRHEGKSRKKTTAEEAFAVFMKGRGK